MIKDYLKIIYNNVKHRQLRSWLTIIGIVIGVTTIVALITVGQGMQNAINEQFQKLGISNIRVVPGNLRGPPSAEFSLPNSVIDEIESVKGVDYVNPVLNNLGRVKFGNEELLLTTAGYDTSIGEKGFVDTDLKAAEGRFFEAGEKNSVLIGHSVARKQFKKDIRIRNTLDVEGKELKVIGIIEETGTPLDNNVYIPLELARELFNKPDTINVVVVKLLPGIGVKDAGDAIERKLSRTLDEEEFDVFTPDQLLGQITGVLGIVQAVLGGIAAIALLVGAIGIMTSMFTSVVERTKDIGIMKAIGATNHDILMLFMIESGLMGIAGGLIGVALGSLIAFGIGFGAAQAGFPYLKIQLEPAIIIVAVLISFVIGVASGALPAIQASRLKPVDALRYE